MTEWPRFVLCFPSMYSADDMLNMLSWFTETTKCPVIPKDILLPVIYSLSSNSINKFKEKNFSKEFTMFIKL